MSFRRLAYLDSHGGGRRWLGYAVVHRPKRWRRRAWFVELRYNGDTDICSRHYTEAEATYKARQWWNDAVADHDARVEQKRRDEQSGWRS